MAKFADVSVLDAALDQIASSTQMYVCSAQPANFAGIAAVALTGPTTMSAGDFTKAAGSPDGRQVTVAAKSAVAVTATGTATHIVLATSSVLKFVTTCTSQSLTSGNTVSVPSWTDTIRQPA